MQQPVRIHFTPAGLAELLKATDLHAIVRAAIDQKVLEILIDRATPEMQIQSALAAPTELLAALRRVSIPVGELQESTGCDYTVQSSPALAGGAGDATPISFEYFRQNIRKMV